MRCLSSSSSAKWTTKASLLATSLIFFCLKPLPVSVSELTTGRCLPRHFVYFNCLGLWALRVISLYFSLSSKGRKMKLKITRRSTMLLRRTRVKNVGRLCVIRKFFPEWVVDLIWIGLRAPLHWTSERVPSSHISSSISSIACHFLKLNSIAMDFFPSLKLMSVFFHYDSFGGFYLFKRQSTIVNGFLHLNVQNLI